MDSKQILLLQDWQNGDETWKAGQALELDAQTADALIAAQTAELYDPLKATREALAATQARAAEEARIADLVKQAVASLATSESPARPIPTVTRVHHRIEDDPKGGFGLGFAEFMKAVHIADAGGHQVDSRLLHLKAPTGMGETVDSLGGFLVPAEFRAELLRRTYGAAPVASRCRRLPISGNAVKIPYIAESSRVDGSRAGGIRAYWTDEGGTKTASRPSMGQLTLNAHKVVALVYASDELLTDSVITLNELINTLVSEELAFQVDTKVIEGTGAGVPLGLLNAPCTISVAKETGQLAATIVSENILKMWARLWAGSRGNAVWFINQDVTPQLCQLAIAIGTGGALTYMPPGGLSALPYATLMGRPVLEIEPCQTLGTVGDIILADMSQYLLGEHVSGMQSASSIHVRFVYDEMAFRFVYRVDGQPWWATALTPYHGSNTVSPFITLATRA